MNKNVLYKYFSAQYGIEMLRTGNLHMSNPCNYNDPFEIIPSSKYLIIRGEELHIIQHLTETKEGKDKMEEWGVKDLVPSGKTLTATAILSPGSIISLAALALYLWDKSSKGELKETEVDEYRKALVFFNVHNQIIKETKVCCFAEKPDNILMWGHYAKGIRKKNGKNGTDEIISNAGIVVSFKKDLNLYNGAFFKKVDYQDDRMPLPDERTDILAYIGDLLTRKARCWSYEEEWRLIKLNTKNDRLQVNRAAVNAIYLGLETHPDHIEKVKHIRNQKYPDVPIYQAKRNDTAYQLDFIKL